MNRQETIEQNLRLVIGDLQVQLIVANATMSELREELERLTPKGEDTNRPMPVNRPNGPIEVSPF